MDKENTQDDIKSELERTELSDIDKLMKLAKRAEKSDVYSGKFNKSLKIAVMGTNSIQYVCKLVKLILAFKYGILANIFEGEYDGIANAILDDSSELYSFLPDVVVLIPDVGDVRGFPKLLSSDAEIAETFRESMDYYKMLWEKLSKTGAHIFQANFVSPPISQLGNLEANYAFSKNSFVSSLNQELIRQKPSNVTFIDFDALASNLGKNKWFDYSSYFLYKQGFCFDFLGDVCSLMCNQIAALSGMTKKCLVLDLDNTLWGGIVGDDGYDGIELDPNNAVGEAYRFFQSYVLELKNRGVILAICSKNEEEIAKEPFLKNKDMLIKLYDIACFIANWDDKATNITRIAKELNIGTDSLVFFDDNPAEREIVKTHLPEVMVIDVPNDPAYYASALYKAHTFDWIQLAKEDLSRSSSYVAQEKRTKLESSFVNYDEYLKALDMSADIGFLEQKQIPRFSQLINKTNQFNLRTQRYSEANISDFMQNDSYRLIYASLSDKFSDYGLISAVILRKDNAECFIDTWLMSCRVLKRGVEDLVFNKIAETAKELGCTKITGEYLSTKRNMMVKDLYLGYGFEKTSTDNTYVLDISRAHKINTFINLIEEII